MLIQVEPFGLSTEVSVEYCPAGQGGLPGNQVRVEGPHNLSEQGASVYPLVKELQ